jgi:hypothetical protein
MSLQVRGHCSSGFEAAFAFAEELLERIPHGLLCHHQAAGRAQRRTHLDEDVVAGRIRVGVGAVEMQVAGARAVEAVRELVRARIARRAFVAAAAGIALAAIDRVAEVRHVDLVEQGELDDVADPGAQGRSGQRVRIRAGIGRRRRHRVHTAEGAHILRCADGRGALLAGLRLRRLAEGEALLLVAEDDRRAQLPVRRDQLRNPHQRGRRSLRNAIDPLRLRRCCQHQHAAGDEYCSERVLHDTDHDVLLGRAATRGRDSFRAVSNALSSSATSAPP